MIRTMSSKVKTKTLESWKKVNKYLVIDSSGSVLTCSMCIKWKSKLFGGTNAFITGSKNLKLSAVTDHVKSKAHVHALKLEEEEQARVENRKIKPVSTAHSHDSVMNKAINNMCRLSVDERIAIEKLFDIAYSGLSFYFSLGL